MLWKNAVLWSSSKRGQFSNKDRRYFRDVEASKRQICKKKEVLIKTYHGTVATRRGNTTNLYQHLKKTQEVPLWPEYFKKVRWNKWCCIPVKKNDYIRTACSRKHSEISSSLGYRSVNILMVYQCGDAPPYVLNQLQSEYWAEAWLKKKKNHSRMELQWRSEKLHNFSQIVQP